MLHNQFSDKLKAFYSDGYKIGMEAIDRGFTEEAIRSASEKLYRNIDNLNDVLLKYANKQETKVYCRKGCFWCCYQPVFALSHEILYLKEFISSAFTEAEKYEILIRAQEKEKKVGNLPEEEMLNSKYACPLLKDGICTAYEARPMSCRIYLSLDLRSCKDFYLNPKTMSGFPRILEFPLQAGRMMNEGFKAALKQSGRNSQEFRIEEGLLTEPAF